MPKFPRLTLQVLAISAVVVCVVPYMVLPLLRIARPRQAEPPPEPATHVLDATGPSTWVIDIAPGSNVVAGPLPSKPFKGQKRKPCTPRKEVEAIGACWIPHAMKPPCGDLYEHEGQCLVPVLAVAPPPTSIGQ